MTELRKYVAMTTTLLRCIYSLCNPDDVKASGVSGSVSEQFLLV